ncbi:MULTISPECIES: hypothetical protein [unclassified Sinorhizobium]|uniref:hypothetical protein n=1 Tax=unclassified Sinorhizobium TaxID=2613772 RepID=UPI0024C2D2E1|nr:MULTISPECIES: hypothetical protein [unclassified Sinorhizobium]MDK1376453.1 hypothetical protein [Sinorhizobium sp. 6-70]MDK1483086.1 hypothetical protein [Sinorhizobium sp. 6-117]
MTKSIAVKADVSTETATPDSPANGFDPGGSWSQISFVVETCDVLTVGGAAVAWRALATFAYTGTQGGTSTATSPPSSVNLTGSSSGLIGEGKPLLRDGDSAEDSFGNKIKVSASGPLRSD